MQVKRLTLIILLLWAVPAQAQLRATGPATWEDTVAGTYHGAFGPGGRPTLCYQKTDGEWDFIVDDWVRVGQRQVWKSVRGNHRVFVDSTGAAIYAKGNHYLGTKTTHLIKFNKADSTWQTLRASAPDSLTISGNTIIFHGIFPGIDKVLRNNPKFLQRYAEAFLFHQAARDSLAVWGPWAGYLLGTATKLDIDSLNLSLRDANGSFDWSVVGRISAWVNFTRNDTAIFAVGQGHLRGGPTTIPVWKRLVIISDSPYLVELFNPVPTKDWPPGTIWHNATFGNDSVECSIEGNLTDVMYGASYAGPGEGVGDSIAAFIYNTHFLTEFPVRASLYSDDGGGSYTFVDSSEITTVVRGVQDQKWFYFELLNTPSLTADRYWMSVWSDQVDGDDLALEYDYTEGSAPDADSLVFRSEAFQNAYPTPTTASFTSNQMVSIYCFYTVSGVPYGRPASIDEIIPRGACVK